MSQRILNRRQLNLQKQETQQTCRKQTEKLSGQKFKSSQRTKSTIQTKQRLNDDDSLQQQKCNSMPNLTIISASMYQNKLIRSHSETDLSCMSEMNSLVNAKSEFHLKSIASSEKQFKPAIKSIRGQSMKQNKRLSNQSDFKNASVTSYSSTQPPNLGFCDTRETRIPIIGYEVMEERARFTVFKLRIENPFTNKSWLVLRRYTDFQRLNNKLKTTFPHLPVLTLPRKKLFGDNFSRLFLKKRVQGLQTFIDMILANDTLRNSQPAKEFFCFDEPPSYSDSTDECRAIFEAQEETINHLKVQLRAKEEVIKCMQSQLNNELEKNEALAQAINYSYENCENCAKKFDDLMSVLTINK